MYTHIPEDLRLQELLDEQHRVNQGGPQVEDRGSGEHGGAEDGGEGADGGQQEHGRDDDQVLRKTSTKLQLVRRRYWLKVGIKRDGLLQPTVNNFFVINSGGWGAADENTKTGSGIMIKKRKSECKAVLEGLVKRQKLGSQEGQ